MKILSMLGVTLLFTVFLFFKGYAYSDVKLWILILIIALSLFKAGQLAIKKK